MAQNRLYYGDNLDVLRRYVKDESVDLVYLDPPSIVAKITTSFSQRRTAPKLPLKSERLKIRGSGTKSQHTHISMSSKKVVALRR